MAKTAVKIGQVIPLAGNGSGIALYVGPGADSLKAHYLYEGETRVKVISISFNRRDLSANALWIQVQSLKDPTKVGWTRFDCGGFSSGMRLRIDRVVFNQDK